MNILHLIPYGVFITRYIDGFTENERYKHCFFIYGDVSAQKNRNIVIPDKHQKFLKKDIDASLEELYQIADIVVFQSIPERSTFLSYILECSEKYNKKIVLVPWGRELFRTSDLYRHHDENLIRKVDLQKKLLIEQSDYIAGATPGVRKFIHENYKIKAKTGWYDSLNLIDINDYGVKINQQKRCNIMLGHRGTTTGGHLDALIMLEQIKSEIDEVICPLSYGNREYIDEVDKLGQELFKEKWHPIVKWIEKDEYLKYLSEQVDIAIFNNSASEGFTTMLSLLNAGKKLYINPENDVYALLEYLGFIVYPWDENVELSNVCTKLDESQLIHNLNCMKKIKTAYEFEKSWISVFDELYEIKQGEKQ